MSYPKITLSNNSHYAEEGQVNPLKWKTMLKVGDNEFKDQSGWWICKDFLNDCVAFFREGYVFSIYSWKNNLKVNDEGVYHLLKKIADKDTFLKNLEVVNKRLNEDLGCVVGVTPLEKADELLILIPPACWENTYRISLVTLAIRLCNYDKHYKSWAEMMDNSILKMDKPYVDMKAVGKYATTNWFRTPGFEDYWYYCGDDHNSKTNPKPGASIVHNCGVVSWVMWMNKNNNKKIEKCAATAATTS